MNEKSVPGSWYRARRAIMGLDCVDVPGPVLFLVVPGQLVAADPVGAVIFGIKAAEEAKEGIIVLPDPVHVHRRKVILFGRPLARNAWKLSRARS